MRNLTLVEISNDQVQGGSVIAAVAIGGFVNSAVWAGWTAFVDSRPEKVTVKKCLLTGVLGAVATATGLWAV